MKLRGENKTQHKTQIINDQLKLSKKNIKKQKFISLLSSSFFDLNLLNSNDFGLLFSSDSICMILF